MPLVPSGILFIAGRFAGIGDRAADGESGEVLRIGRERETILKIGFFQIGIRLRSIEHGDHDLDGLAKVIAIEIGQGGYVLQPGELYLGHTLEQVGSNAFVPLLFGRSSVGRLGLFVEITAPIGDIGFHGQWTLMLSPVRPLRVYAGMKIGQIMFFVSTGAIDLYRGKYQAAHGPQPSRYWQDMAGIEAVAS